MRTLVRRSARNGSVLLPWRRKGEAASSVHNQGVLDGLRHFTAVTSAVSFTMSEENAGKPNFVQLLKRM